MIRALNHILFTMTDRTYDAWCPEKPLSITDDFANVPIDVESLPFIRCVPCCANPARTPVLEPIVS